jgi:proteic killer suppression protein
VIQSFANAATADLFHGKDTRAARGFDTAIWPVIWRKLDMVNVAHELRDLQVPPDNRLHPLKGDQKGRHAFRVNEQYRITFRFENGNAYDVRCEDYH